MLLLVAKSVIRGVVLIVVVVVARVVLGEGVVVDEVVVLEVVVVSATEVVVGSGFFSVVDSAAGVVDFLSPVPEDESPTLKRTTLALAPLGTVTTQKLAPPAPFAC